MSVVFLVGKPYFQSRMIPGNEMRQSCCTWNPTQWKRFPSLLLGSRVIHLPYMEFAHPSSVHVFHMMGWMLGLCILQLFMFFT
jgi:hypothetical protein